jgi:CRP-like cAMP-binding protein
MTEYPLDNSCSSCIIRTHPLFRHLGEEELQDISLNKITETYRRGSIVYREGNRMKGFYCVQSGIVKIYKTGFDGKEQIVRFAKPGDLIAYRSVVSNEAACTTAELMQEGTLCHIPTDILFHLVKTNGGGSKCIYNGYCPENREGTPGRNPDSPGGRIWYG